MMQLLITFEDLIGFLFSSLYSCMTQLLFSPLGALPIQKTKVFFIPIKTPALKISLSFPVVFQQPDSVARLVRSPVGYFRSFKLKKYHSFSPIEALPIHAFNSSINHPNLVYLFLQLINDSIRESNCQRWHVQVPKLISVYMYTHFKIIYIVNHMHEL